eukprot:gene10842-12052_t
MLPTVCVDRYGQPGALWTTQLWGDFVEGDPQTKFIVEGRVDVKQLGGWSRAFFQNIVLKPRPPPKSADDDSGSDKSSSEDEEEGRPSAVKASDGGDALVVPKLAIYLSTKKPKKRMVDVHKLGQRLLIAHQHQKGQEQEEQEGVFGSLAGPVHYEASLMDVIDLSAFQGLVVVKLPQDEPVSDEPVVFGFVRFQSSRARRIRSLQALALEDLGEAAAQVVSREKGSQPLLRRVPLRGYRELAGRVWQAMQSPAEGQAALPALLSALDQLDLFTLSTQAERLFEAVDVAARGRIGLEEVENFLVARALLQPLAQEVVVRDVFDALKDLPCTSDLLAQPSLEQPSASAEGGKDKEGSPVKTMTTTKSSQRAALMSKAEEQLRAAERERRRVGQRKGLDFAAFREAVEVLGYAKANKTVEGSANPAAALERASAEDDDLQALLRQAFCFGAKVKEKEIDSVQLSLDGFRKAWLKIADVPREMAKRGLQSERGLFAESRDRDRLLRTLLQTDQIYLDAVQKVNAFVLDLKADQRRRRDESRREKEARKERLQHEANRFLAQRGLEKRLQLKKEQEERSRKRVEDKVLRNKLLVQQQENLAKQRAEIAQANAEKRKLRSEEVQRLGLDRIDLSVRQLREVPSDLFRGLAAQQRLAYVVAMDFSRNLLEALPKEDLFFFHCTEVRKCKFSENRIRHLPADFAEMTTLEILEIDKNRLEELPVNMQKLVNLQRLDLANNKLSALPEALGSCQALKFLSLHSNDLSALPSSLGQLYRLEYLDVSRNLLRELPEDLENLVSLLHLDLSSNQLGYLFHGIGQLQHLLYLDVNTNLLAALPASFSQLRALEYVNLENNELLHLQQCLEEVQEVKYLNLRKNNLHSLAGDVGGCRSLTALDISLNKLSALPIEVGLCEQLIDLNLAYNQLTSLPAELGACRCLVKLSLRHNAISGVLPPTLSLIRSLQELDISDNLVDSLPDSIAGFQELVSLNANRCQLRVLPPSIVHLPKLKVLSISSNHFQRFPIHLQQMVWLEKLDLSNNSLTLLPRDINTMAFLHELNLRNNQLQALPVEFVEVFETVPQVDLSNNPWTLLPNRWGHQNNPEQNSKGFGYSLQAALDFLYAVGSFYSHAERIWEELGVFYYSNRLGLEDFLIELKRRVPHIWHDGLRPYAEHLYFKSKEGGFFLRWYELSAQQKENERLHRELHKQRRENNVNRSHRDLEIRAEQDRQGYEVQLYRRVRQAAQLLEENRKSVEVIETLQLQALQESMQDKLVENSQRQNRRQSGHDNLRRQEAQRLQEVLHQDRPVRVAEKAHLLQLRREEEALARQRWYRPPEK